MHWRQTGKVLSSGMIETIRTRFRNWLMRGTAPAVVALPEPTRDGVSYIALAESHRTGKVVPYIGEVFTRPKPMPGQIPTGMAMDSVPCFGSGGGALLNWAVADVFNEGLAFLGYQYLAQLAQRAEYRRPAEIWAEHAVRKGIKLRGPDEGKLKQLQDFIGDGDGGINLMANIREALEQDGLFGRSQIFMDFDDADDPAEMSTPLLIEDSKISPKRPIKRLKVMEPMWSYPGTYDSTNPLRSDFYRPSEWYVYGMTVANSRMLTFVSREVPDMLKPAYAFGGLSLTQMAKPYVDNWLSTRQSVNDLIQAFSQMVLTTDMQSTLSDGGALFNRLDFFNRTRNNRGIMAINEDEKLENITTSLASLDKLQAQAQEHLSSVCGVPLVILLGITPSGLNASSEGEIRVFYDAVMALNQKTVRPNVKIILDVCQLSLFGSIDPGITFEFPPLWEMDAKDLALIRKSDADADMAYCNGGVVSPDEVRERLSEDETGLYRGVDLSGPAPEPEPEETPAKEPAK